LSDNLIKDKTQFATQPLKVLTDIHKELDLNHDVKHLIKLASKMENSSPNQVLLFVEEAFRNLLKIRDYPLAEIDIQK
jgi:hypothetical protein